MIGSAMHFRDALRRFALGVALLLGGLLAEASGHTGVELSVVLDTDMALDDVRAIVLLSQYEGVDLLAGVTSDGACAPQTGAANLRWILARLDRDAVPVAAGRVLGKEAPPWRSLAESLRGPNLSVVTEPDSGTGTAAVSLLVQTLAQHEGAIYLCLGPLSNLADVLAEDASLAQRIAAVHYYGSPPDDPQRSWNTTRDLDAAKRVYAAGLRIHSLQLADEELLRFDSSFLRAVCGLDGRAADLLCELHSSARVQALVQEGHFRCWDEAVVLGLLFPELIAWRPAEAGSGLVRHFDVAQGRQRYLDLLSEELSLKHGHRHPVGLRTFPTEADGLRADVAAIAPDALSRHGTEEWNAILLTNELHRHLGIYSILGAKLGIRARELLDAGLDELTVVSCAGSSPPLSCLTDGLQVATGATLGRGTIRVDLRASRPGGVFHKGKRALDLTIKDEIVVRIRSDIQECIAEHGALTPAYWSAVRSLALRYWLEVDRAEMCKEVWLE
jgi:pyrimidine-specific ribonucleoside hydrolase